MIIEALYPGIKFVHDFKITESELVVLMPLIEKPRTSVELVELLGMKLSTIYGLLQKLIIRKVLIKAGTDGKKNRYYKFNIDNIE